MFIDKLIQVVLSVTLKKNQWLRLMLVLSDVSDSIGFSAFLAH